MIGASGARAGDTSATFRVPDPEHELAGVRLRPDVRIAGGTLDFRRSGDGWELVITRPPVSRMEYLVELRYPDGSKIVTDPGNPRQAAGAFGPKSVLEFPSYPVTLHEVADMHNYTAWRDAFDPHLTRLLRQMCP